MTRWTVLVLAWGAVMPVAAVPVGAAAASAAPVVVAPVVVAPVVAAPGRRAAEPVPPRRDTAKPATAHPPAKPRTPRRPPATTPKPIPPKTVIPVPAPEPEPPAAPTKGTNSGLPLPRFATLRSDEVYMRSGPGPRYPIDWVYKRRDLPVEIEREFDIWRLVRDVDGVRGWVNTQTLAPRRSGVVLAGASPGTPVERALRKEARDDSPAVARLKPGVIVRLRSCDAASDWCAGSVQDYRGYIRRAELWGVYPGETIQ